ncbi:MAG: glycine-rich domain-containing protein, partial [Halobacteriaceae archaeon]
YPVKVGAGGDLMNRKKNKAMQGVNGQDSRFGAFVALGGGGGNGQTLDLHDDVYTQLRYGNDGGCGGGGASRGRIKEPPWRGGDGKGTQESERRVRAYWLQYFGNDGAPDNAPEGGEGGGGSRGPGTSMTGGTALLLDDLFGEQRGYNGYFAAGGAGFTEGPKVGNAFSGAGSAKWDGGRAQDGTGSGGGGLPAKSERTNAGGSGIVLVRYLKEYKPSLKSPTINLSIAYRMPFLQVRRRRLEEEAERRRQDQGERRRLLEKADKKTQEIEKRQREARVRSNFVGRGGKDCEGGNGAYDNCSSYEHKHTGEKIGPLEYRNLPKSI